RLGPLDVRVDLLGELGDEAVGLLGPVLADTLGDVARGQVQRDLKGRDLLDEGRGRVGRSLGCTATGAGGQTLLEADERTGELDVLLADGADHLGLDPRTRLV